MLASVRRGAARLNLGRLAKYNMYFELQPRMRKETGMGEPVTLTVEALTRRIEAIFQKAGLGPDHAAALELGSLAGQSSAR